MDTLLVIAVAIIGILIALAVGLYLLIGMVFVWPLSLILILLGGFTGGGVGALIGAGASGIIGIFVANS